MQNRELKFRGWDADLKLMLLPVDLSAPLQHYKWLGRHDVLIMQFTGLLDKNGKEIYEGDIVEWKYLQTWHKNEVRWVGGGFVVTTSGFKDDLNEPQDLSLVSILSCEIIGNIYENPELIHK